MLRSDPARSERPAKPALPQVHFADSIRLNQCTLSDRIAKGQSPRPRETERENNCQFVATVPTSLSTENQIQDGQDCSSVPLSFDRKARVGLTFLSENGLCVSKQNPASDGNANRRFPCAAETIVRAPVPQFLDEIMEVMTLNQQERINESLVDVPAPHLHEETVEVMKLVPQERIDKLFVDVPVPQIFEQAVEMESQDNIFAASEKSVWKVLHCRQWLHG